MNRVSLITSSALVTAFLMTGIPKAEGAACNPTNAPPGSVGCQPPLPYPPLATDLMLAWRPSLFPNALGVYTMQQIANFVGSAAGFVVGPVTSTVGHVALWGNNSGTILTDGGALGTAAFLNSGTVGAVVPELSNINTFGAEQFFPEINVSGTAIVGTLTVGGNLLTLGGAVDFAGAFPGTITLTGSTSVTMPTSGTLATTTGSGFVTGPGSSTAGHVATYADTSGKVLQDTSTITVTIPLDIDAGTGAYPGSLPTSIVNLGNADATNTAYNVIAFGASPQIAGVRAAGTRASPTAVQANQPLIRLQGFGYGATGWSSAFRGSVNITAADNWTDSDQGTYIDFFTTAAGGTTTSVKARMGSTGDFLIGTTTDDGTDQLQVAGGVLFSGLATSGTIAGSICRTSAGVVIYNAGATCFPSVAGPGSSTVGHLASFNNTGGSLLADSGVVAANVAQTNTNNLYTAAQRAQPSTLVISTSTFTPNFDTAQNFSVTLVHASCPCTMANPSTTLVPGQSGMMAIAQSATGSDTIGTWGSDYKFAGGTAPTLSTGANAVDFLPYYVFSTSQIIVGAGVLNAH